MSGLLWFLAGAAAAAAVSFSLWLYALRRQQKRLFELTAYLEAASCGREMTLVRTEDAFSILEDEIYKTVGELRTAREQALKERRQQADNLADIAHQLKTPLTSMSLMTQLLGGEATAGQLEYVGRIDSQLARLDWLTGSLLTMSRLDAGAVEFNLASLPFEELAAQAMEPMEQLLREREQTLTVDGKELPIVCDPYWTAEALVNLIKNCSEHMGPGGNLLLKAQVTPLYVQVAVEDDGQGFVPEEIPYLFRRFFKGINSGRESIGIGLALCRAIVEGQGGIIRAENRPEGGARFVIRFYGQ